MSYFEMWGFVYFGIGEPIFVRLKINPKIQVLNSHKTAFVAG